MLANKSSSSANNNNITLAIGMPCYTDLKRRSALKNVVFYVVLLALFALNHHTYAQDNFTRSYFDYAQVNFAEGATVTIRGKVEFYWGELLTPNDFRRSRHNKPAPLKIPSSWTELIPTDHSLPATGCATYRFSLIVPRLEAPKQYALYIPLQYSSYRLWVNGKQLDEAGKVANNPYDAEAKPHYALARIRENLRETDTLEVILQMSNYSFPVAGLVTPIKFGTYDKLLQDTQWSANLLFFVLGLLILLAIVNLILFRLHNNDQTALWIAVASIFTAINLAFSTNGIFVNFLNLSWSYYHKIVYLSGMGAAMSLFLFMHCRYRKRLKDVYVHWLMGIGMAIAIFVFFTPVAVFTMFRALLYLYILVLLSIIIVRILTRAVKEDFVGQMLFGYLLFFVAVLLDVFQYIVGFESFFPYIPIGISVFLLTIAYSFVRDFAYYLRSSETYKVQLDSIQLNYEAQVKQLNLDIEQQQRRFDMQQQEQQQQVWVDSGIAMLSTVMAQNQNNMQNLCTETLLRLTKYMHINIALLYVARIDIEAQQMKLYMQANFGLTTQQLKEYAVLDEDQGLVGACYRDNTFQHISNLPEGFIKITSGLGESSPPSILLVPLQSTAGVVGVLELGRFDKFQDYEIAFVKRLAIILANNIIHTKNNEDFIVAMQDLEKEIASYKQTAEKQEANREQLEAELEEYRRAN